MCTVPVFKLPRVIIYRFVDVLATEGRMKHDFMTIASGNLQSFLEEFFFQKEVLSLVEDLRMQSYEERERNPNRPSPVVFKATQTKAALIGSLCFYLNWRMKKNSKKADLGKHTEPDHKLIKWVVTYSLATGSGTITVHDRFVEALKKRHALGIRQFVYSRLASAAVDMERKLLAFTSAGDLTPFIAGYFNPNFLNPSDEMSYSLMADCLGVEPSEILFVTTRLEECRIAKEVGFAVVKVKRPDDIKDRTFPRVKDMSAMDFQSTGSQNELTLVEKQVPPVRQPSQTTSSQGTNGPKSKSTIKEVRKSSSSFSNSVLSTKLKAISGSVTKATQQTSCSSTSKERKAASSSFSGTKIAKVTKKINSTTKSSDERKNTRLKSKDEKKQKGKSK